jgi:hypothetical protein
MNGRRGVIRGRCAGDGYGGGQDDVEVAVADGGGDLEARQAGEEDHVHGVDVGVCWPAA